MSRQTRRKKYFSSQQESISVNTIDSLWTDDKALLWPGTTLTPEWWVQGVNIIQEPEWYISPQEQIRNYNIKRENFRKWQLMAEYKKHLEKGGDWWDFMKKLDTWDQDYLNSIIEEWRKQQEEWFTLRQAPEYTEAQKQVIQWFLKKKEQLDIAESDEWFITEAGVSIIKWVEWLWQSARWLLTDIDESIDLEDLWLIDKSKYDPEEVRRAETPVFAYTEWTKHQIERTQPFDASDLWTRRFWVDTIWSQVAYMWPGIWAWIKWWQVMKNVAGILWLSQNAKGLFQLWGMTMWSTMANSLINWWTTYDELRQHWATHEEASAWAHEVMIKNMATALTDLPQFALIFSPLKGNLRIPKPVSIWWVAISQWWEEIYEEWRLPQPEADHRHLSPCARNMMLH